MSNWGGYGLAAYLCLLTKNKEFFESVEETIKNYIKYIVIIGSIDGVTHENKEKVDGNDIDIELNIFTSLLFSIKAFNTFIFDSISFCN